MEFESLVSGKWVVVSLSGRMDAQTSTELEKYLQSLIEKNNKFIAIDMTKLSYMSSAGLRIILATYKGSKAKGGSVVLIKPNENIQETLTLSGFSSIFMIFDDIKGLL